MLYVQRVPCRPRGTQTRPSTRSCRLAESLSAAPPRSGSSSHGCLIKTTLSGDSDPVGKFTRLPMCGAAALGSRDRRRRQATVSDPVGKFTRRLSAMTGLRRGGLLKVRGAFEFVDFRSLAVKTGRRLRKVRLGQGET